MVTSSNELPGSASTAIQIKDVDFAYGTKQVLYDITLDIPAHQVTAFIGPSGCGKSTLIRCINRINDRIPNARVTSGSIHIHDVDIHRPDINIQELRRRVGMVFQKYNPFAKSIYDNVVYGLRIAGTNKRTALDDAAENALRNAALWDEVKDRLHTSAFGLSGGQQQRLCIARVIATEPDIILMDEPCAALDPLATLKIEELIGELKKKFTIIIVTHNMQQATRCSDRTAFMYLGRLIEYGATKQIFENPTEPQTEAYITGAFG
ncbi:MAG: phosphate ABC transporter ATP-binding protein [Gloeobacteraceae cyanobacterium ES-bin-144]|nr:phosphate ABC transporter ATP-binding protein [Verrucomicrobiales bacterium]